MQIVIAKDSPRGDSTLSPMHITAFHGAQFRVWEEAGDPADHYYVNTWSLDRFVVNLGIDDWMCREGLIGTIRGVAPKIGFEQVKLLGAINMELEWNDLPEIAHYKQDVDDVNNWFDSHAIETGELPIVYRIMCPSNPVELGICSASTWRDVTITGSTVTAACVCSLIFRKGWRDQLEDLVASWGVLAAPFSVLFISDRVWDEISREFPDPMYEIVPSSQIKLMAEQYQKPQDTPIDQTRRKRS